MKHLRSKTWLHLLWWSGFILIELLEALFYYGKLENLHDYIGSYFINIGLFYTAYFLLPKELLKLRSVLNITLLSFPLLLLYMFAKKGLQFIFDFARLPYFNPYTSTELFVVLSLNRGLRFFFLAIVLGMFEEFYKVKLESKILAIQKLEDEAKIRELQIANLQAKIDPHLIFNTLCIIHNTAIRGSEKVPRLIELLAEIMEFSLKKPGPDEKIPLDDELQQIRLQAELNKLRMGDKLNLLCELNAFDTNFRIIPSSLSSLSENLFKHALTDRGTEPLTIKIDIEHNRLRYYSFNKMQRSQTLPGYQLGVETLRKRLEHYYPQKHCLDIKEGEDCYEVNLCIFL